MTACVFVDEDHWLGIHYMPTPTIIAQSNNAVINASGVLAMGATSWTVKDGAGAVVGSGTMSSSATDITVCTSGTFTGGGAVKPGYYTVYTNSGTNGVVAGAFAICTASSNLYVPNSAGDNAYNLSAWIGGAADRDYYSMSGGNLKWEGNVTFNGTNVVTQTGGENFTDIPVGSLVMSNLVPSGATVSSVDSATQIHMSASATGSTSTGTMYCSNGSAATVAAALVAQYNADQYFQGAQDTARPRKFWIAPGWQSDQPVQAPDPTFWGGVATYFAAHGHAGAYYECPTNEPENGGWSTAQTVTYWNACAAAILAADATAHIMGFCSGGIYSSSSIAAVASFLSGATHTVSAFTNHMENSNQNLGDIVMLRQYFGGLKAQFASSGVANMDYWNTETGIVDGYHGVLMPRRAARQRTVLRFVAESYGWAKENAYDFPVIDHQGSGLPSFLVDWYNPQSSGNLRAGAYAMHVQSEALFGTTCNPTTIPSKISFGSTGSVGDSLFAGLHYTATAHDVMVIATNGIESDTVTLNVSDATGVTCWDGWGATRTVTVSGSHITFAVDDLLTYVFLPNGVTVSVVDTGSNVITQINSATNLAASPSSLVNEAATSIVGVVNNGSFSENNAGVTGISTPYVDTTVPSKITATISSATVGGVVIKTAGPPWQGAGSSLTAFTVKATVGGVSSTVDTYACASAVSFAVPSPSGGNSSDICTRTTWWTGPFAHIVPLALAGPATVVELDVASADMTGQPDTAAANVGPYGTSMEIQIAEFQIFQGTNPPVGGVGPQHLMRFGMG